MHDMMMSMFHELSSSDHPSGLVFPLILHGTSGNMQHRAEQVRSLGHMFARVRDYVHMLQSEQADPLLVDPAWTRIRDSEGLRPAQTAAEETYLQVRSEFHLLVRAFIRDLEERELVGEQLLLYCEEGLVCPTLLLDWSRATSRAHLQMCMFASYAMHIFQCQESYDPSRALLRRGHLRIPSVLNDQHCPLPAPPTPQQDGTSFDHRFGRSFLREMDLTLENWNTPHSTFGARLYAAGLLPDWDNRSQLHTSVATRKTAQDRAKGKALA